MASHSEVSGHRRPATIDQALRVLDEAWVEEMSGPSFGESLRGDLKRSIAGTKVALGRLENKVTSSFSDVSNRMKDYRLRASEGVNQIKSGKMDQNKQLRVQLDRGVKENFWMVLGGIALGTLAIGFLFGRTQFSRRGL